MATATAHKKSLQILSDQKAAAEQQAFEEEAIAHIETRASLREQMRHEIESAEAKAREYERLKERYRDAGEAYRADDGDSQSRSKQLREDFERLGMEVNNWRSPPSNPGQLAADELVATCRDLELKRQFDIVSDLHSEAAIALDNAHRQMAVASDRASEARNERIRILASLAEGSGAEGNRWRRVTRGDEVTVEGVGADPIHASNVQHINEQLARSNRQITESLKVRDCDHEPQMRLQDLTEQLESVRAAMIESEI